MNKIGITGGIGSGKSLVCQVFERLGVPVFYADQQAKWLYDHDQQVRRQLIQHFGPELYDQKGLKRALLASKIFNNPEALKKVNGIVHPVVREKFLQWCRSYQHLPYVLEEAAILFESGAHEGLDYTILVYAPQEIRIQRVMERDQASRQAVSERMHHQMADEDKMDQADFVIYNDGSQMVIPQILNIHRTFISK
ncbi:MAG: dephospho-CoA kinase [Bacteroidales bacterium]|nr:dephospho-CoA kinase [Bacteroidales bacterium]